SRRASSSTTARSAATCTTPSRCCWRWATATKSRSPGTARRIPPTAEHDRNHRLLRLRPDPPRIGAVRRHRAQPGARGAVPGAVVLHRLGHLAPAARRVPRHHAGAGLRRRRDGAVPVRGDDARRQHRAVARRVLAQPARRAGGRRADGLRDDFRAGVPRVRHAAAERPAPELQQHQGAGAADLYGLRLRLRDRGRGPAGGDRRGDRAYPAPPQGRARAGSLAAGAGAARGARQARLHAGGEGPLMPTLSHYLVLAAMLFAIAVVGIFLNRKNVIVRLMAIELMLLAVNLNFIAFSHYLGDSAGQVFVFFILTVAAAESAIGLAIL